MGGYYRTLSSTRVLCTPLEPSTPHQNLTPHSLDPTPCPFPPHAGPLPLPEGDCICNNLSPNILRGRVPAARPVRLAMAALADRAAAMPKKEHRGHQRTQRGSQCSRQ